MSDKENQDSQTQNGLKRERSVLVDVLNVVVPAATAIVVAYFGYRQVLEPKQLDVAAAQTEAARAVTPTIPNFVANKAATNLAAPTKVTPTDVIATEVIAIQSASTATANPPATPLSTLEAAPTPAPLVSPTAASASGSPSSTSSTPTGSPTTESMVTITTAEGAVAQVIADTLRIYSQKVLNLNSGEIVAFEKIVRIDVGKLYAEIVPIEITFTDGVTLTASMVKDADFVEGETLHSTFQNNMYALKQMQFPNQLQSMSQSALISQPMITITNQVGEVAQVIAGTLRVSANKGLGLSSGEFIPVDELLRIDVGEMKNELVPIEITFTDGTTMAATLVKDTDYVEGETVHGTFQKYIYALKQLEFPNQLQSISPSALISEPMITITNQAGEVAQVIAGTLRVNGEKGLGLSSGEFIPVDELLSIEVGELKNDLVPIEITFTDGTTMGATLVKDADYVEGETVHGTFQKYIYALKQLEFPNQP